MAKISLIIATYNAGKTLEGCLRSIVKQITPDIELIIIDGASKDNTLKIINDYRQYISYFVSERDRGIYDAWNKGIKASHGKWIMFLGADDRLLKGSFKVYLDFLSSHETSGIDIICGKCRYTNSKGKLLGIKGEPYNYKKMRKYMDISHGSSLHNRKLFDEIGHFDISYKICADYDFLIRKPLKSLFIDRPLIEMETGGMSFSTKALKETYWIRKKNHTVNAIENLVLLVRGLIAIEIKKHLINYN